MDEVRDILRREQAKELERQERNDAYGRFGEIVVEAWLRERQHLEVLPFPRDRGSKSEYVSSAGKRADFLVTIPPNERASKVDVLVDAKFHTIREGEPFYISKTEMARYDTAMAEWGAEWLFFAVINANDLKTIHWIERSEMTLSAEHLQYEYVLGSIPDRSEALTGLDLRLALERFTREGFSPTLLPDVPLS